MRDAYPPLGMTTQREIKYGYTTLEIKEQIMDIENEVTKAQAGDKQALEHVVAAIQDNIYYLALRMLCHPDDARDATQEILIIVITKLSTFQFRSRFKTWVYRVAANYLLRTKKILDKDPSLSFDDFKQDLESDLQSPQELRDSPDYALLLNEIRISCTMAMLLCLDHKHRMAYILGDIFDLDHTEASECLSLSKDNYRQQLTRARAKIIDFTSQSCGLVSSQARCSCDKKLTGALRRGRIDKKHIRFAGESKKSFTEVRQSIAAMSQELRTITLQTSIPSLKCPDDFVSMVATVMEQN